MSEPTMRELADATRAANKVFRLMAKFHLETDCGNPYHWAECDALCDFLGFEEGWEEFRDWWIDQQ